MTLAKRLQQMFNMLLRNVLSQFLIVNSCFLPHNNRIMPAFGMIERATSLSVLVYYLLPPKVNKVIYSYN